MSLFKLFRYVFLLLAFSASYAESIELICESPMIYLITDFLTPEQCDYIIRQATPKLKRSMVLGAQGDELDERRTSEGMFFFRGANPLIKTIEEKIALLTQIPVEYGEGIQVLHYRVGGEYQPHYDYFTPADPASIHALSRGGQRVASLIMYLNDTEEGGETVFPSAKVSITPKKGCAVLFYNVDSKGVVDPKSLHGGAPVIAGEKWIATKWLREGVFN